MNIDTLKKEEVNSSLMINFFPESISKNIFSTKNIVKYTTPEIVSKIKENLNNKETLCFRFSVYKGETERRILGIPHISNYLLLTDYIADNINFIYEKIKNNSSSNSKNIFVPYEKAETFNEVLKTKLWNSIGNKYIVSLDISRCYENIYTHSITWALVGKEKAKEEHFKGKGNRSIEYKIADGLDERIRKINNNETKGIPTGPITSRLISELILSEIDNILKEKFPKLKYNRFVDDYRFYFLEKTEAIQFIPKFQKILYDFKFSLNESKTKIELFPNGIFTTDLTSELGNYDFTKNNIISFIKKFMFLHNSGVKGAFKYGIKVLSSQKIRPEDKKYVLACLINSLTVFPMISDIIIDIFEKNELIDLNNKFQVEDIFNKLLEKNIADDYDEEIFWSLYFLIKFDLKISLDNILNILNKMENFTSIMAIDYIFEKKLNKSEEKVKEKLYDLKQKLKTKTIYSDEWLLLYECSNNNWIDGLKNIINKDYLLKKLLENKEKFYISPYKN